VSLSVGVFGRGWGVCRGFVENQSNQKTMSDNKDQPSVPANEGLIMSGNPTRDVMPPGIMSGMATGVPSQTVGTQGSLGSSATCVQSLPALPGGEPAAKLDPPLPLRGQKQDVNRDGKKNSLN